MKKSVTLPLEIIFIQKLSTISKIHKIEICFEKLSKISGDWSAKALLLERGGDIKEAAKLLLDCLSDASQFHLERLDAFLNFAKRVAQKLSQSECDEYFLPLFDVVSSFSLDLMRELLPRALVGLFGLVSSWLALPTWLIVCFLASVVNNHEFP